MATEKEIRGLLLSRSKVERVCQEIGYPIEKFMLIYNALARKRQSVKDLNAQIAALRAENEALREQNSKTAA